MKTFKTRLELNNKQRTLASKHAGVARYAYNWGKTVCDKAIADKTGRPSAYDLQKKFVAEEKSAHPWLYEVSKCAPQHALRNLDMAYKRVFKVKGTRYPRFKKKGQHDSFYLEGDIATKTNYIKIPKFGYVKCSEVLPDCEIKNVSISKTAGQWFIAFRVPFEPTKHTHTSIVGVDLGIKTLATISNGDIAPAVSAYRRNKRKLKLLQRSASRKVIASKNRAKANQKVAKLHYRIANIRKDAIHKLTTDLAKNHGEIVIEDLNVSAMSKNHKLASAILDGGFNEFRRQLDYKCKWYGATLTIVDRFYPSSKTCSDCGYINKDLRLSDRVYKCPDCGLSIDRDLNAAINLMKKAVSYTASACGEPNQLATLVVGGSMKQEVNSIPIPLKVQGCVSFSQRAMVSGQALKRLQDKQQTTVTT